MVALRRWIATDGKVGVCPDWYGKMQIAKYLRCTLWELAEQPLWWQDKAAIAMTAEKQAADIKEQRNRR